MLIEMSTALHQDRAANVGRPADVVMSPTALATVDKEATNTLSKEHTTVVAMKSEGTCEASENQSKRGSAEPRVEYASKRKKHSHTISTNGDTALSDEEASEDAEPKDNITRNSWQGFCEIESEPAFFSAILQDMGVQDIIVREIFSMTPEYLETLPRPIYGLILLYQYRKQDSFDLSESDFSHVWFANQLPAQNSCATLAMINILMNSTDIETGEHLRQFKEFTRDFTPYQRGEALASFDFVKKIHNSFAKKMDILEADKHLSFKVKKSQRQQRDKKSRRKSTESAATDDSSEDYEENAHHFIAYIPVGGEIWMLDGLNAQPINVGTFDRTQKHNWVSKAADSILAILASGGDNYTGFAIMPSSLPSLREQACLAINHIKSTESQLDIKAPDWRSFITDNDSSRIHLAVLGIEDQLPKHRTPDTLAATIASEEMQELLERRARVDRELSQLASSIDSEMQDQVDSARKAAQGRFDHGPVIKLWAEMLAENGYLEQNLDRFIEGKGVNKKGKK